jgi:transposase
VFSDVFGKSASRILDNVIALGHSNFDVAPLLDRRCKASIEDVKAALDGELSYAQSEKLKIIRKHMKYLESLKDTLETLICKLAEQYQPEITLLLTVPGISSPLTAIRILAEIGSDMSVFETAKKLCSWAGVTPQNNESAGKKKTTRISRAGAYLKPLLVQIALAVSNSSKHPEIKDKYHTLKKRRGHKKAVIAIARRLLTAVWHILKKQEPYNAQLYRKADKPPANRQLTPEQAFALLRRNGYQIIESASVA